MKAAANIFHVVEESGVGTLEVWDLEPAEETLYGLLRDLFSNHWHEITFGPLIQGAAFEIRPTNPPKAVTFHDGYLTVDFGSVHFHLCIAETLCDEYSPTDPILAQERRTHHAELFRRINRDQTPDLWGLRLFNGLNQQQFTVLFPNPFVSDMMTFEVEPDWSRLRLWNKIRQTYLGLPPDEKDRSGRRMLYP